VLSAVLIISPGRLDQGAQMSGAAVVLVPQGLVRLNTTSRQLQILASRVAEDSSPIAYANGLDIAANGSIYFTASTDIFPSRSRDGSYDTGFAWAINNFRGLPRYGCTAQCCTLPAFRTVLNYVVHT
jgi:sugar lactone lactonase YvrE